MKLKATVAYNGSGFHGFATTPNTRTVAGEIEKALAIVVGQPVKVDCAGRTDKGVHGRGQVISFDIPDDSKVTPYRIQHSLNGLCRPGIVVRDMQFTDSEFHARFSAQWRQYRYQVLVLPNPDPLRAHMVWHINTPVDIDAMNEAATHFLGTHNFTSFCKKPKVPEGEPEKTMMRSVLEAEWFARDDDIVEFWVKGTAFCHQMVRSFVGTLVDVGIGQFTPDDIPGMIAAENRRKAGRVAPPNGLTFWKVQYDAEQ